MGVSILLCQSLLGRAGPGRPRPGGHGLAPLLLVLVLVGYYGHSTARRIRNWFQAGCISTSILTQARRVVPVVPPNSRLLFDQIPAMHGDAYVFSTSFPEALHLTHPGLKAEIAYDHGTVGEPAPAGPAETPFFRYRYLSQSDQLVQLRPGTGVGAIRDPVGTGPVPSPPAWGK